MPLSIVLSSELFGDGDQRVMVRDRLPVHVLIADICREYELADALYSLRSPRLEVTLDPEGDLESQGVKSGDRLVFGIEQPVSLSEDARHQSAFLRAADGQTFPLPGSKALIGRPNPAKQLLAAMLAVDLTPFDPDKTTSRPHAQITREGDVFLVESLRADNPVYVNDQPVALDVKQPLSDGDVLLFGKQVKMVFCLESPRS